MAENQVLERNPLKVTEDVQVVMHEHYIDLMQAKSEGKPILLAPMAMPYEIFHAMGVPILSLEAIGAMASVAGQAGRYCQIAEEKGHSRDICSFTRCFSGIMYAGDDLDPVLSTLYTQPDILLGTTWACSSQNKAFQYAAQYLKVPHFTLDAPVNSWGKEVPDYAIAYYVQQLKEMIGFLEEQGYKMDWDKLKEEVAFSIRARDLQDEIDSYVSAVPCPLGGSDAYFSPFMAIQMMGQKAFHLLEKKRDEIKERVENGIGVIDNEQIRLLWWLSPPIYNFELLHYAEKYGAVVVQSWIELVFSGYDQALLDPANPLESVARKLMCRPDSPNFQFFPDAMIKVVKQLKIDGVIDAVMRSCGVTPGLIRTLKDGVFEATGVPSLMVDADYGDERECDETAVKASLDTFIATLLRKKGV